MSIGRTRLLAIAFVIAAAVAATATGSAAVASGEDSFGGNSLRERLTGYEEDPQTISTAGSGTVVLQVNRAKQEITYRLSYTGLEGAVTQAHIHFGGRAQSGAVVVFLCTNLGNGPAGTQACPPAPATITGTIRPGDVLTAGTSGITAGQFDEFVAAIRAGVTYANVHSMMWPGGEIRAQLGHH